jgi:hypothetical protein
MRKICSAILSVALVLCMGVMGTLAVNAVAVNDSVFDVANPPPTRLSYISNTVTSISISGGQATCLGHVTGYNGTTTKVEITLYLERKLASSSTWSTYASDPKQTFNSYSGTYQMKKSVVSGYQYRVRAVYVAWAGSKSETLTGYSSVVSY